MSSPPGIEKIDWYATPELQIVLCFCCLIHADLKKRHGKVNEQQFWRTLHHHIPYVADLVPGEPETLINRLVQRGDKLNRYQNEHPTHRTKCNSTGRFWGWACDRYTTPKGEFTLNRETMSQIITEITGYIQPEIPDELEETINLNELIQRIEYLEGMGDGRLEKLQALEARITALENQFKRR